ncbi:hypothetical protein [Methanolobus sp. WCC5]|uniref:hypothetical protein n=1 Tax=Methanolobus sp. WCC5 TaxID=3125785 RepID=UPI003254709D
MSEELFYQNQLQNLEDIKAKYFIQLDEIEKKRAEIALKKEQIKSDESLLIEEYRKIHEAKKLIAGEYEKLADKNEWLKAAKKEFEEKRDTFSERVKELESQIKRYELDQDSLQKRKSEHYRVLRSQYEEEVVLAKRQKRISRTRSLLDEKIKDMLAQKGELASYEMDIEVGNEKIARKREYLKHLNADLSSMEKMINSREKELSQMRQQTEDEIGKHVTIHKQHLNMINKDSRIEQQMAYIKVLEDDMFELRSKLKSTSEELAHLKICSRIFEQNLELLAGRV